MCGAAGGERAAARRDAGIVHEGGIRVSQPHWEATPRNKEVVLRDIGVREHGERTRGPDTGHVCASAPDLESVYGEAQRQFPGNGAQRFAAIGTIGRQGQTELLPTVPGVVGGTEILLVQSVPVVYPARA